MILLVLFFLLNVNETGWSVCRSLLGCCAPAVCRSGFARWCSCVLLFSGAFVRCVCGLMVVLRLGLLLLYSCLGVPAVFPSSFVLSSWTLVVGLTSGLPWFMSCHVLLYMHTQPLFSWAGCVCVDLLKRSKTCTLFDSRGAELFDATLSNEATHQRGKSGLITLMYLLHD